MKKLSFLILGCLFLFVLGCQKIIHQDPKSVVSEEYQNQVNLRKSNLRSQLTSGTYMGALVAYQDYSDIQKFQIWKDKLEDVLQRKTLTDNQRSFIETYLAGLSETSFSNPLSDEAQLSLISQANALFGSETEVSKIFCTPFDYDETPPFIDLTNQAETMNCHCKWNLTCQANQIGNCADGNCDPTHSGCGWFWHSSCTFICDEMPTL